jgi:signal transduction histidine kinase
MMGAGLRPDERPEEPGGPPSPPDGAYPSPSGRRATTVSTGHDCPGGIPSSVVHELRTPLTAIHGYAQLLQRNPSNAAVARRGIEIILRETGRLASLLNQLSEVAELDTGALKLEPTQVDVGHVARDVAEQVGRGADAHELVVEERDGVEGRCDPRRLAQVLSHVVGNAVKYAPEGGRITIEIERQGETTHIAVADPGIGIPSEDDGRVYERYYRGRAAERTGARGLGLGLYVAREVASRCGGRIWHEPAPNGGTIFHVLWPDT